MEESTLKRPCNPSDDLGRDLKRPRKLHLPDFRDDQPHDLSLDGPAEPHAALVSYPVNHTSRSSSKKASTTTSMPSTLPSVYRVQGSFDKFNILQLLEKYLGGGCQPQIQSFATASNNTAVDQQNYMATVSFKVTPEELLDGSYEWTYPEDDITIDSHFKGLTTLFCPEPSSHKFDIISICGLGGHALGSFKERGGTHVWLRDSLPSDFPQARIIIYGYDSHIYRSTSLQGLEPLASSLRICVEGIYDSTCLAKPIVFIAHSLGGLVLKEALIQSNHEQSHLLRSTSGALLFGVPNQGMDIKSLLPMAENQPNLSLLHSLHNESEFLEKQNREFLSIFNTKDAKIFCFYETMESPTAVQVNGRWAIKGPNAYLVSKTSASCCLPFELQAHRRHGLNRTHSELVKFRRRDEDYNKVRSVLRNTIPCGNQPKLTPEQWQNYLDALSFTQLDSRLDDIKAAYGKTCTWLLERPEYKDWLNVDKITEHHGFLWIKGKPGAGKSTMMKYAFSQAKGSMTGSKVISFFFNARGDDLEKSTEGMYRSLLYKILTTTPAIQSEVVPYDFGNRSRWNIEGLQAALIASIKNLGDPLVLFIDALDECEEDEVRDMVEFLETIAQAAISCNRRLNICLSSRHYPYITVKRGIQLIMEGQEGHNQDISKYMNSKLRAGNSKPVNRVKEEILSRASGVFLWVVLVIPLLNKAYDHGRTHALQERLKEIPDGLDDLFSDILTRDSQNIEQLVLCLQWVLYSRRPLQQEECYFAILSGSDPSYLTEYDTTETSMQDIERFILSCSKGLAEVTKTKHRTVQFIHESVRDFLSLNDGFSRIQSTLSGSLVGTSHKQLTQCCYNYIKADMYQCLHLGEMQHIAASEAKVLRTEVSAKFPFLDYAVHNILFHSNEAEGHGTSQSSFLKTFSQGADSDFQRWVALRNLLEKFQIRRYTPSVKLLYVLAEKDHSNIILYAIEKPLDYIVCGNERYSSPILAAIVHRNEKALRKMLSFHNSRPTRSSGSQETLYETKMDEVEEDIQSLMKSGTFEPRSKYSEIVLFEYLYQNGCMAILERIIAIWSIDTNHTIESLQTLLSWAASDGHEAIVKQLFTIDAVDPDSKEGNGKTPLLRAAENGHEAVVKLLLTMDAVDLNSKDAFGQTPLSWAAENGHEAVVILLLTTDAVDLNSKDAFGQTPLSWAAENGHEAVVKLLLAIDAIKFGSHLSSYSAVQLIN